MQMLTAPRFDVSINGQHRCIAGFDNRAVLSAGFSHVFHKPEQADASRKVLSGPVLFRVAGLEVTTHLQWLQEQLLVGDEVKIVIRDGGPIDRPVEVVRHRAAAQSDSPLQSGAAHYKIPDVPFARLEVLVNGKRLCTAGVDGGVLTTNLTWTWRDPQTRPAHYAHMTFEEWESGYTDLFVGGLENGVHLEWHVDYVNVGDEVTVRALGPGPVDEPRDRTPAIDDRRP